MICLSAFLLWQGDQTSVANKVTKKDSKMSSSSLIEFDKQFSKPYPQDDPKNHTVVSKSVEETTKRLLLLKKMARQDLSLTKEEIEKLHQYYFKIAQAPNEVWPVRVQAFRNLRNMKTFKSWSEREKVLQQVDKRILHLSQYSDQELLEKAVEHGQNL